MPVRHTADTEMSLNDHLLRQAVPSFAHHSHKNRLYLSDNLMRNYHSNMSDADLDMLATRLALKSRFAILSTHLRSYCENMLLGQPRDFKTTQSKLREKGPYYSQWMTDISQTREGYLTIQQLADLSNMRREVCQQVLETNSVFRDVYTANVVSLFGPNCIPREVQLLQRLGEVERMAREGKSLSNVTGTVGQHLLHSRDACTSDFYRLAPLIQAACWDTFFQGRCEALRAKTKASTMENAESYPLPFTTYYSYTDEKGNVYPHLYSTYADGTPLPVWTEALPGMG